MAGSPQTTSTPITSRLQATQDEEGDPWSSIKSIVSPLRLAKNLFPGSVVREPPKNTIRNLTPPAITAAEDFRRYFTELDIAFEYKQLAEHCPKNIHVLPSKASNREWHAVIFVHEGPFSAGIFLFTIYLTDLFPRARPIVKFISHVSHPYVNPKTGVLNFSSGFPSWTPHHDHIWHVLEFVNKCFYDRTTWFEEEAEFNEAKFNLDASKCVQESLTFIQSPRDDFEDQCISLPIPDDAKYLKAKKLIMAGKDPEVSESSASLLDTLQSQLSSVSQFIDKIVDF